MKTNKQTKEKLIELLLFIAGVLVGILLTLNIQFILQ
jgi:hypothetical protein